MADIHIHREHRLGLAKARKIAWRWAETAEQTLGVECSVIEGKSSDVVEFKRAGVEGRVVVTADSFDLSARLGLLVGAFRSRIEAEIEANLDALFDGAAAAKKKPAAKAVAKKK